jgi:hypothetical protein
MTESEVTKESTKFLKSKGIWHRRFNAGHSGHIRSVPGNPDFIAILPKTGLFWGIEFKGKGGKPSKAQLRTGIEIQDSGGVFTIARFPTHIKALEEAIRVYDR